MICVLLRVPLFANSSFPIDPFNSWGQWGANFGSENGHSGESRSNFHSDQSASFCEESGYLSSSLCHFVRNWANGHLLSRAVEREQKETVATHTYSGHLLVPKGLGEWEFSAVYLKSCDFQQPPKVRSICMRKITFAIQSRLHGFPYKSL